MCKFPRRGPTARRLGREVIPSARGDVCTALCSRPSGRAGAPQSPRRSRKRSLRSAKGRCPAPLQPQPSPLPPARPLPGPPVRPLRGARSPHASLLRAPAGPTSSRARAPRAPRRSLGTPGRAGTAGGGGPGRHGPQPCTRVSAGPLPAPREPRARPCAPAEGGLGRLPGPLPGGAAAQCRPRARRPPPPARRSSELICSWRAPGPLPRQRLSQGRADSRSYGKQDLLPDSSPRLFWGVGNGRLNPFFAGDHEGHSPPPPGRGRARVLCSAPGLGPRGRCTDTGRHSCLRLTPAV